MIRNHGHEFWTRPQRRRGKGSRFLKGGNGTKLAREKELVLAKVADIC